MSVQLPPDLRVLAAPLDLRVGERTVVQPDLMVVPRSLVVGGDDLFETDLPLPVRFRPADLAR